MSPASSGGSRRRANWVMREAALADARKDHVVLENRLPVL